MKNHFAHQIEEVLAPILGSFVAKMTLGSHCKHMGITPESIGPDHLQEIAKRVGRSITAHGKKDQAISVANKIVCLR